MKKGLILASGNDTPYAESIVTFLTSMVSGAIPTSNKQSIDLLENAFFASGNERFGPLPDAEHLAHVRGVIRNYVAKNKPIPVLIPWGSIKAKFGENVDMAEVMAIQQITALIKRVNELYQPGLEVVVRIEDTSGYSLFQLEGNLDEIYAGTQLYSQNMRKLVSVLDGTNQIETKFESEMTHANQFGTLVTTMTPLFKDYLADTDELIAMGSSEEEDWKRVASFKHLQQRGWNGIVPTIQRNHYYKSYEKLYEGDKDKMRERLALYFAGSLARHFLDMTGKASHWQDGFIQLAFVAPIPGIPEGYNKNYVYYRTLPENYGRTHMPAWRAKGYLLVSDKGGPVKYCPKITNWHDPLEYNPMSIEISNGSDSVIVSADYVLNTKQ